MQLDLYLRLVRGPLGTWEISWSNVTEVDSSLIQPSNPKPSDSFKPKHPTVGQHPKPYDSFKPKLPIVGQHSKPKPISNPKPKPISYPKPTQTFGWPNTKPKALPASNPKPNIKPIYKWKPKPHRPSLTQYLTRPHSSQAPPTLPFSSAPSVLGSEMSDTVPSLTHMDPTCTEKLFSVLDNSEASNIESLSSDASLD